ncbi:hypothetical protein ACC704_38385, partial [Rhizobium johnstonii]|uniref:hypothetical protein n=1 Tax=Rhizobium johnstonii TaxID=3019933 RepID=UPI003F9A3FB6
DPYTRPMMTEVSGTVQFEDLVDGLSVLEATDESTERKKRASPTRDSFEILPLASLMTIAGLRSEPRGVERQSIT